MLAPFTCFYKEWCRSVGTPNRFAVMSKSVWPKDLTDKISFGLTKSSDFCCTFYCSDWQDFQNQSEWLACLERFQHLWIWKFTSMNIHLPIFHEIALSIGRKVNNNFGEIKIHVFDTLFLWFCEDYGIAFTKNKMLQICSLYIDDVCCMHFIHELGTETVFLWKLRTIHEYLV